MEQTEIHNKAVAYRADIDGLRAIAVLSVMAYHLHILKVHGGYVGVDVFFVISGYLISSIIFSEIATSRFSIVAFYERRIRRIFPALFGMLITLTILATILFLPTELIDYSKSLLAATTSVSNFYFWRHSGYFDASNLAPLIHTWSLAVEEQFYILFPIFLTVVRRLFPEKLRVSVIVLFIASLAGSALVVYINPDTAFYMPYTRAWELLLGTLLSLKMFPRLHSALPRNLLAFLGIAMIGYSAFFYTPSTPFPGITALVPCIGSALIIGVGESGSSLVSKTLSWRPVVFLGLISYSLYLWHWPVIVLREMGIPFGFSTEFPSQFTTEARFRANALISLALSLVLAILSWRFIERPFRKGAFRPAGRTLFAMAGGVISVTIAFSLVVMFSGGFGWRFSPQALRVASHLDGEADIKGMRSGVCFISTGTHFKDYNRDVCLHQDLGKKTYLVLGDSHSAALWPGLSASLTQSNVMQASVSNCKPFVHASLSGDCGEMMRYIFQSYLPAHPIQGLFLEGRFQPGDVSEIADTVKWARDHHIPVVLFGPMPEYDAPLPRLLSYSTAWKMQGLASQHTVQEFAAFDTRLQAQAALWNVPYVSLYQAICGTGSCIEYADAGHSIPLMIDKDHLSGPGSVLVAHRLIEMGKLPL